MRTRARIVAFAIAALVLPAAARADEPPAPVAPSAEPVPGCLGPSLRWDPEWRRFETGEGVVTGVAAAITLTTAIVPPLSKHRYGGVLFDEDARDTFRLPSVGGRFAARDTSDAILSVLATSPYFVDAAILAWWYRGSRDVARQMSLIALESMAVAGAIQGVTNFLVSRERPYARGCGGEVPGLTTDCEDPGRFRSFFSGHSVLSFTSASLICSNHTAFDLLGGPWDASACVLAYAAAATTASLRVMGDMHYATDVLTGSVIGTVVGLGIPALHYRRVGAGKDGDPSAARVYVVPTGTGAAVGGIF